jgi:predicted ATP-grasp superfamily ATP-dependent carboligase
MSPRVLLTNAEERSMLAACRGLHRAGYEVTCASFTALAAAQWSRACHRRLSVADPRRDAGRFVEQLRGELTRLPYTALLPGSDSALLAISRGRERLAGLTALGLPAAEVIERVLSRERLAEAAREAGLTAAESIRCAGPDEVPRAAHELGFPVVLKSTHAVLAGIGGDGGDAAPGAPKGQIVGSEDELGELAATFGAPLLVQRVIPGELISCGGVHAGGRLPGVAVSRYLRTWPPDGGSVTFSETMAPPPGLEDAVRRLLGILGWEGIFELELIRPSRSADAPGSGPAGFVAIDLNPRPYGSMALANAAGAPLATIWCDWLLGRHPRRALARPGCRYRWEDGDLRHLAWQLRRGRYRAAAAVLRPHRNVTHAHFEISDPLPLPIRGLHLASRALDGGMRMGS